MPSLQTLGTVCPSFSEPQGNANDGTNHGCVVEHRLIKIEPVKTDPRPLVPIYANPIFHHGIRLAQAESELIII